MVLSVGVNDLPRRSNEEIIKNYRQILAAVPPAVPVIFSAVLPFDEETSAEFLGRNRRVQELNRAAKQLCASFKNCQFLDSGGKLIDRAGNLAHEYHVGDGVHLNAKGYSLWISELNRELRSAYCNAGAR